MEYIRIPLAALETNVEIPHRYDEFNPRTEHTHASVTEWELCQERELVMHDNS